MRPAVRWLVTNAFICGWCAAFAIMLEGMWTVVPLAGVAYTAWRAMVLAGDA